MTLFFAVFMVLSCMSEHSRPSGRPVILTSLRARLEGEKGFLRCTKSTSTSVISP